MTAALDGARVLEIAHYIAGPQCCQVLADHGADVVKIEPPGGEHARRAQPVHDGESLYFAAHNRNKRSVTLDLRASGGREVLDDLIRWADVLVTNYATEVPEKLGFGFERVHERNPRAIMVHITGFGRTGPKSSWVAYDGIVQSMSGLADLTGAPDGPPTVPGLYVADHMAAMQGVIAALLGLAARERTGTGQLVDVGMLDAMVPLLAHHVPAVASDLPEPRRRGSSLPTTFSDLFPSQDGWVCLAPVTAAMWERFCTVLGHDEWAERERDEPGYRLRDRHALEAEIQAWTRTRTSAEIVRELQARGIVCGPVHTVREVVDDQHVRHRDLVQEVDLDDGRRVPLPGPALKLSGTPAREAVRHPALGEQTEQVLHELGYSGKSVGELRAANVIGE